MSKVLMKGNEAIAQAAIAAGCNAFFGYPITPQNELIEYMSKYMPDKGAFVQAESELAAINMVYGASAAGAAGFFSGFIGKAGVGRIGGRMRIRHKAQPGPLALGVMARL